MIGAPARSSLLAAFLEGLSIAVGAGLVAAILAHVGAAAGGG